MLGGGSAVAHIRIAADDPYVRCRDNGGICHIPAVGGPGQAPLRSVPMLDGSPRGSSGAEMLTVPDGPYVIAGDCGSAKELAVASARDARGSRRRPRRAVPMFSK